MFYAEKVGFTLRGILYIFIITHVWKLDCTKVNKMNCLCLDVNYLRHEQFILLTFILKCIGFDVFPFPDICVVVTLS